MAAARYASAYTVTNTKGSVLLLPHGSPDIIRNTRRENMVRRADHCMSGRRPRLPTRRWRRALLRTDLTRGLVWRCPGLLDQWARSTCAQQRQAHRHEFRGRVRRPVDKRQDSHPPPIPHVRRRCVRARDCDCVGGSSLSDLSGAHTLTFARVCVWLAGVANPDVGMGGLTDYVAFGMFYPDSCAGNRQIVDLHDRCWVDVPGGGNDTTHFWIRPKMSAVMSSAILAAPGPDTGELLIGYPFTSVSTSSTEIVRIQLRVYLGAVLKRPENVLILRNVYFEGLREGSGNHFTNPAGEDGGADDDAGEVAKVKAAEKPADAPIEQSAETVETDGGNDEGGSDKGGKGGADSKPDGVGKFKFDTAGHDLVRVRKPSGNPTKIDLRDYLKAADRKNKSDHDFADDLLDLKVFTQRQKEAASAALPRPGLGGRPTPLPDTEDAPAAGAEYEFESDYLADGGPFVWYQGTVKESGDRSKVLNTNNGHLGPLDNPSMVDRLWGTFVYNPNPDPNPHAMQ